MLDPVLDPAADPATVDLTALATRVGGPELALRTAARTVAAAGATPPPTGGADDLDAITSVLPRQEGFPRWFATVTAPGADQAPSLVVLRSPSAREPYVVWATPSLLPGASLPTLAAPAGGVAAVPAGETVNLPLSPRAAAEHYAEVLTDGAGSAHAGEFADDAYRDGVQAATRAESAALAASGGSFEPGALRPARRGPGGAHPRRRRPRRRRVLLVHHLHRPRGRAQRDAGPRAGGARGAGRRADGHGRAPGGRRPEPAAGAGAR